MLELADLMRDIGRRHPECTGDGLAGSLSLL